MVVALPFCVRPRGLGELYMFLDFMYNRVSCLCPICAAGPCFNDCADPCVPCALSQAFSGSSASSASSVVQYLLHILRCKYRFCSSLLAQRRATKGQDRRLDDRQVARRARGMDAPRQRSLPMRRSGRRDKKPKPHLFLLCVASRPLRFVSYLCLLRALCGEYPPGFQRLAAWPRMNSLLRDHS
jgi:hypothetical protein